MRKAAKTTCVMLVAGLISACAKQGFPPGGPVDRTPPEIVATSPPADATGLNLNAPIWIQFSERMDRSSVEASIFCSPAPKAAPEFDWKGRRLFFRLPDKLQTDKTYVITVATGAKDRQGNPLAEPYTFAFSTGESLDFGKIVGEVTTAQEGKGGVFVWAYDLEQNTEPDPAEDPPEYITQTTEKGSYSFDHLSPGTYRIFAFGDNGRDGRYTVEEDPLAVPSRDVTISGPEGLARLGDLCPVVRDTTCPRLLSARATDQNRVELSFDETIDLSLAEIVILASKESAGLSGLGEDTLSVVERYVVPEDEKEVYLLTEEQKPKVEYTITLRNVFDLSGNPLSGETRSATFVGSAVPDSIGPRIISASPVDQARNVPLDQPIRVIFSEAMRRLTPKGMFWFDGVAQQGKLLWTGLITLVFSPSQAWQSAQTYCFNLNPRKIFDYAGNALVDSTWSLSFRTVNIDTLGFISGEITDKKPTARGPFHIRLKKVESKPRKTAGLLRGKEEYHLTIPEQGKYSTGGILPGRYLVFAFRDEDGDGRQGYGKPSPFVPAERATSPPDTVAVRSRWTTDGIDLKFEE